MARGGGSGASSGQQAKSERRILTPHVAHTETRAKPVDGHDGSWPRSLHVGVFHCLSLHPLPPPAAAAVFGCVCLAGRRVNCFYLIVADTNAHVACHSLTSCCHLPLPRLFLARSSFDIWSGCGCGGALLVIAVWAPLLLSCQSSEACAKLLLVVNLLLPLLANLVGQADMQMLLPLPLLLLLLLLPLSNVACLLFFMQIFALFFSLSFCF